MIVSRKLLVAVLLLTIAVLGLGLYVWHLGRSASQIPPQAVDARPISPPVAGPPTPVVLFVPNDDDARLVKQQVTVALPPASSERGQEILKTLLARCQAQGSSHPIDAAAAINGVYLTDSGLAVVDANAAFAEGHRSGILVEELTLASVTETLAANLPNITRVKFLIDGKERTTLAGHADLSDAYELTAAAQLVK
jgi:spore germination protein GerM